MSHEMLMTDTTFVAPERMPPLWRAMGDVLRVQRSSACMLSKTQRGSVMVMSKISDVVCVVVLVVVLLVVVVVFGVAVVVVVVVVVGAGASLLLLSII